MKTTTAFAFLSLALLYSPASYADTFGSGLQGTLRPEPIPIQRR